MAAQREINISGGVLVGHDGSQFSAHALNWALDYARAKGGLPITIARIWSLTTAPRPATWARGYVPPLEDYADAVLDALRADVAPSIGNDPGLEVSCQAVHGKSGARLIEASARADILVVGRRGMGGFTGLLLGSVSSQVLSNAQCTVVVVKSEGDAGSAAQRSVDSALLND